MSISPISPLETIPPPRLEVVYSAPVPPRKQSPNWFERHWKWLVAVIAIAVSIAGLMITVGIYVVIPVSLAALDGRVNERIDTKTSESFERLEGSLAEIQKDVAVIRGKLNLAEASTLSPAELAQGLPEFRQAMAAVKQAPSTHIPAHNLLSLKTGMASVNPDTPGYWPAALEFVEFATAKLAPSNVPLAGGRPALILSAEGVKFINGSVRNAVVLLDKGEVYGSTFENSRIIFTTNPVTIRQSIFINCVFQMPVVGSPNDFLKEAAKQVLASDLSSVKITL